jgi:hypothetical protein
MLSITSLDGIRCHASTRSRPSMNGDDGQSFDFKGTPKTHRHRHSIEHHTDFVCCDVSSPHFSDSRQFQGSIFENYAARQFDVITFVWPFDYPFSTDLRSTCELTPEVKRTRKVAIRKNGHFGFPATRRTGTRDAGFAVRLYGNGGTKFRGLLQ